MPIIASETIHIDVNRNRSIKIQLLNDFVQNKCIHIPTYASAGNNKQELYNFIDQLVGEKAISCDKGTCCITENYSTFVEILNNLKKD